MGDFSAETISHIDRAYIRDLLKKGERIDGRAFDEYRDIEIQTGVVTPKAEGSAIARIGNTRVIAGVKVLAGEPYPDTPDEGIVMIAAEMAPIASPFFELGPPGEDAIELARVVDRGVRESEMIDVKKLCVEPGRKVYMVFCDLYTLEHDGNLIDACAIATAAALLDTKFPEVKEEDGQLVPTGKTLRVPIVNLAVEATVAKIGEHLVMDPLLKEEMVQDCRITMAVDEKDNFTAMQKGGGVGPISVQLIERAMDMALDKTKAIRTLIRDAMK
ncbi:MAG: exosome complex protein Rrp42 [Candidatus Thorarchaeota archaeon]|nr:exosome complex protein Rrp42 [Candidatus Thorarchaeota archaeon]